MSKLLAADGYTLLQQQIMPLTSYTVTWFTDGRQLLLHANDLSKVSAKLVCNICEAQGGIAHVLVVAESTRESVFVACPHRPAGGVVKLDQPLEVGPLLLALGWNLHCPACGQPLRGDNDPTTASKYTVTCCCTSRVYQMAMV